MSICLDLKETMENDLDMSRPNFIEVPQYGDEFAKLQQFAKTFDHHITPLRHGKVLAFQRRDIIFGYADIVYLPVAFPAFHPGLTKPRDVVEILQGWKSHCELSTGGEGYIGTPLETNPHRKNFPEEIMIKVGLEKMERELFKLNPIT